MLVSVIVPVYNAEKYLCQCLDSIMVQTYECLEVVVVDDGSTDGSGAICDAYAQRDARVRVIHQENKGVSAARNIGLMSAGGKMLVFLDAGDWLEPDAVLHLVEVQRKHHADIVVCNVAVEYDAQNYSGQYHEEDCPLVDGCFGKNEIIKKLTESQAWYYITFNKLLRRSLFDGITFPEGYIHEDAAVVHRLYDQCNCIAVTTKKLYHYRQADGSTMNSGFSIRRTDLLSALADRLVFAYRRKWENLFTHTMVRYVHTFFDYYFCFPTTSDNKEYFSRMEKSLKLVLPYVWRCREIGLRHKLYMSLIRISPKLYRMLKKIGKR